MKTLKQVDSAFHKVLIEAGFDLSQDIDALCSVVDASNKSKAKGETALTWALQTHNPKLAQALLEAGADSNTRNAQGNTPLYIATTSELVQTSKFDSHYIYRVETCREVIPMLVKSSDLTLRSNPIKDFADSGSTPLGNVSSSLMYFPPYKPHDDHDAFTQKYTKPGCALSVLMAEIYRRTLKEEEVQKSMSEMSSSSDTPNKMIPLELWTKSLMKFGFGYTEVVKDRALPWTLEYAYSQYCLEEAAAAKSSVSQAVSSSTATPSTAAIQSNGAGTLLLNAYQLATSSTTDKVVEGVRKESPKKK